MEMISCGWLAGVKLVGVILIEHQLYVFAHRFVRHVLLRDAPASAERHRRVRYHHVVVEDTDLKRELTFRSADILDLGYA